MDVQAFSDQRNGSMYHGSVGVLSNIGVYVYPGTNVCAERRLGELVDDEELKRFCKRCAKAACMNFVSA